jgi:hypothetical protein
VTNQDLEGVVRIGAGLLLIAVGAILRFAVQTASTHGFNVHTMGDILMLIGILGLLLWLFVWGPGASLWRGSVATRVPRDVERTTDVYTPERRYRTRLRYRNRPAYPADPQDAPAAEYPTLPIDERDERYR